MQRQNLKLIPLKVRRQVLLRERIYLPISVKSCPEHFAAEIWSNADREHCEKVYTVTQIEDMVDMLRIVQTVEDRNQAVQLSNGKC